MRLLLDTHILLWIFNDSPVLKETIRHQILSAEEVFVSVGTLWEIMIKKKAGKLECPEDLREAILKSNLTVLPITMDDVLETGNLDDFHKDPFDRIITAQAICRNLVLVTKDVEIFKYKVRTISA